MPRMLWACAREGAARLEITARNLRCSAARMSMSAFHAASVSSMGREKKLLPGSANEPRFSPVSRRRATYFQYAACSVSSQML